MTEPPVFHITNILERRRRQVEGDRELASTRKTCRNAVAVAWLAIGVLVAVVIWKVVT